MNDALYRELRQRATRDHVSLKHLIESALRTYLRGEKRAKKKYTLKWRTERGRVLPGVRLDDRDALFDLMDGRT